MFNSPLTFNDLNRSTNSQNQQSTMAGQTSNQEGTSYLPGYLSSAARGSNIPLSTPPRQSQSGQPPQSSLSRSPLSTSQSSAHQGHSQSVSGGAFGAGSLFGSISTPLSKSPRSSLYGRPIEDDQEAPPTTFLQDEENVYQQNTTTSAPSAQQIHNLTPWHHAPQPVRQQSPIESRSVTFYGMNDAIRARMMDIFIPQFGAIENVSDGINWIDVVFVDSLAAQRALKLSGKRVDELGGIMLGVKLTHQSDDQQSGFQGQQQQQFDNSKHLTPLPPSQAFKPSPKPQSSTTTIRTMFNTPNKSTNEYGITPEQADSQPNRQTIGGKIADLIFGF
ncbi:hypothetical protein E3Q10_00595 [Wallemia mellicola]|uniref:RRM Nup35-type domain-containing protein n=1 Tax=Wallemia mellicola TaxID=1708541 RepID=A0A4T0PT38_9BASI|nr:hypothetical protein E3Q21_04319 [Wallemia mellicola]TIB83142.1 hypothetical protein E3Q20_04288 [Wallemia mellicola]TIC01956.1 hypothetical protein E3Q17_01569 [Wallemia mellicola]TIC12737.1 hypothetical protein E3Q14_01696 [Wallemia mellicola]TIC33586.1 hypothetical protein E3Q10_00595 [Wallemia mellicola]